MCNTTSPFTLTRVRLVASLERPPLKSSRVQDLRGDPPCERRFLAVFICCRLRSVLNRCFHGKVKIFVQRLYRWVTTRARRGPGGVLRVGVRHAGLCSHGRRREVGIDVQQGRVSPPRPSPVSSECPANDDDTAADRHPYVQVVSWRRVRFLVRGGTQGSAPFRAWRRGEWLQNGRLETHPRSPLGSRTSPPLPTASPPPKASPSD